MGNLVLYVITVLIWGSTWIAIEFQVDEAAVEATLLYRFSLASVIMLGYCLWRKIPLSFSIRDHAFILLLALLNFSINYIILYEAQKYLTSAMASIAFSTLLLLNILNTRIFFGTRIQPKVYVGAVIGITGILVLFYPTIAIQTYDQTALIGLVLALGGTLVASLGNMVSVRNSRSGMSILAVNAWGMIYGTLVLAAIIWVMDIQLVIPSASSYWISLVYISIFGTVIAFACYFMLMSNIGPERASYVIVLFPVIAIIISIFVEDFQITSYVVSGFLLVALGNLLVLTPTEKLPFVRNFVARNAAETDSAT